MGNIILVSVAESWERKQPRGLFRCEYTLKILYLLLSNNLLAHLVDDLDPALNRQSHSAQRNIGVHFLPHTRTVSVILQLLFCSGFKCNQFQTFDSKLFFFSTRFVWAKSHPANWNYCWTSACFAALSAPFVCNEPTGHTTAWPALHLIRSSMPTFPI